MPAIKRSSDAVNEKPHKLTKSCLLTPENNRSPDSEKVANLHLVPDQLPKDLIQKLFSHSTIAKIWGVAEGGLRQAIPPLVFPEYTKPGHTEYIYRDLDFWTSGFFPGSLYLLLQRERKYRLRESYSNTPVLHEDQLQFACKWWTENLHQNAVLGTTHDLGFMIAPWAKVAWELNRDQRAFETLKSAAKTLHGRFRREVGLIRSWDTCVTKRYQFLDPQAEFLTVIDNMMNLDLLFYVAKHTGNVEMYEAAVQHARTTQRTHIREDYSTVHLVHFDPSNGDIRQLLTNQGYKDTSCWTRGQAWAIAGFAETYHWTHDKSFLDTARNCADHFLRRLPDSGVPPWDFDAAEEDNSGKQPPDVSAAAITSYGLLLIHEALVALGHTSEYLGHALSIMEGVSTHHMNSPATFVDRQQAIPMVERPTQDIHLRHVEMGVGDTILNGATINNHEYAPRQWANHGLVYADYYFLLFGNKLLQMDARGLLGKFATLTEQK
ncbi:hypothetical protein PFICI_04100 [Pestalotiopsis fici W106-1]|uniref:Unsaturated glucuronyl hydrolase n=1 Tax=Pestalotiopsis fici (strain W106-1 / CGMCC3.15140) TaxID=1229662 RepID=W3XJ79_PESFW|nr:uncharacterized protein PFICI_04100 [Pestalotiopsis fici W106-1]ETS86075.1 hypothetical protein PFICI_04100 [Pestalotiopsis fici W106-1]